jgi:RNA polymerase sigma-70 factor (ECF subfamily)
VKAEQLSDILLLKRYVNLRDESAFAALVERHGPVVHGICRRVLRSEHDAEDVFQTTFMVLARKAAGIPWRGSIRSWLSAVATRLALGRRADVARCQRWEMPLTTLTNSRGLGTAEPGVSSARFPEKCDHRPDPAVVVERRDLSTAVGAELLRLPEKYRAPLVLCYLEGKTHAQAAAALGWPTGSVSRRMEKARLLLRNRLARRGLALAVSALVVGLAALMAWSLTPYRRRDPESLRQAMVQPKAPAHGDSAIDGFRAELARGEIALDSTELGALALRMASVATRIERHDPGRLLEQWRSYATQMHNSALELAQAARYDDPLETLAAARRLDAACLRCHEVFRQ